MGGLIARDLSWLSAAILTLLLAVVPYVWYLLRLVVKEEAWGPRRTDRAGLASRARMAGAPGPFSIMLDATIIAVVGAVTYWAVDWLRASP